MNFTSMKVLLAISGASGTIYGKRVLDELSRNEDTEVHLIVSKIGEKLIKKELDKNVHDLERIADETYGVDDLESSPASGSSLFDAMLIVPCSVSTVSKISSGIADNLITRAATVMIKEGKRLILVPRETPLSTIHLENLTKLSNDGALILPAMPAFYHGPGSINDLVDFITGKILDNLGIDNDLYDRWSN